MARRSWHPESEAAGPVVSTVREEIDKCLRSAPLFGLGLQCNGMVTLTFTVGLPSLNLSGNTVTDKPRDVSPKRFQVQSSWRKR